LQLDFDTIVMQLRRQYKLFALIVLAAIVISVIVALRSRPIYRAEAVVAPVSESPLSNLGGLSSSLGGLAGLAGGLLSGGGKDWNKALAVLRSRHLIEELVTRENLLPVLFPEKRDRPPTMGDAVVLFQHRIMQVREDPKSGLATVRIEWFDPKVAAQWANELVAIADEEQRDRVVTDADSSLKALQRQLAEADGVELRTAIAHLIEEQLKSKTVAGVRTQFQYQIIDRAVPADPDKRVQPTRTVMVLAGTLAGILLGLLVVLTRHERARKRSLRLEAAG
jgi:uncharacterized protein involved in exopolysaccharide biosynthesis